MNGATAGPVTLQRINLDVVRGTDVVLTFVLTDEAGNPINLADDGATFTVRDTWSGTMMMPPIVHGAGEHAEPANGKTAFELPASSFDAASETGETVWLYEVRRTTPSGQQYVHVIGELRIHPAVNSGA